MAELRISSEPNANWEEIRQIQNAVDNWQIAAAGTATPEVIVFLRDEGQRIVGGALGDLQGGWLRIQSLWVDPALDRLGYAAQLLRAAEADAQARGARGAYLETNHARSRPFYEQQGYVVFAAIEDFPPGYYYYMLRKTFGGEAA